MINKFVIIEEEMEWRNDYMFSYHSEWNFQNNHESIIVGLFDKSIKLEGKLQTLDELFDGELTNLVKDGDISAKKKSITVVHTFGKIGTKRIVFVGLGKEKELSFDELKEIFGATFKRITSEKWVETAMLIQRKYSPQKFKKYSYFLLSYDGF